MRRAAHGLLRHVHMHASIDDLGFILSRFHPDRLRYPAHAEYASAIERARYALSWNIFRAFEQLAPAAWMRPMVAGFTGIPDQYASGPHTVTVACWETLSLNPSSVLRRGQQRGVRADVVVSTEDTVLSFVVPGLPDLFTAPWSKESATDLLELADSTSWIAGRRAAYTGIVMPMECDTEADVAHIRARAERLFRAIQAGERRLTNLHGIGVITWRQLIEVLRTAAESPVTTPTERDSALAVTRWASTLLQGRLVRQRNPLAVQAIS
jgi:hypothetical protein